MDNCRWTTQLPTSLRTTSILLLLACCTRLKVRSRTVLVHARGAIPSIRPSVPGTDHDHEPFGPFSLGVLSVLATGSGQCACEKAQSSLGTGHRPCRDHGLAARPVLGLGGSALGGEGHWRVGFTRQNEAIGVIKLPAMTGTTQHLQLASSEHG